MQVNSSRGYSMWRQQRGWMRNGEMLESGSAEDTHSSCCGWDEELCKWGHVQKQTQLTNSRPIDHWKKGSEMLEWCESLSFAFCHWHLTHFSQLCWHHIWLKLQCSIANKKCNEWGFLATLRIFFKTQQNQTWKDKAWCTQFCPCHSWHGKVNVSQHFDVPVLQNVWSDQSSNSSFQAEAASLDALMHHGMMDIRCIKKLRTHEHPEKSNEVNSKTWCKTTKWKQSLTQRIQRQMICLVLGGRQTDEKVEWAAMGTQHSLCDLFEAQSQPCHNLSGKLNCLFSGLFLIFCKNN